MSKYLSLAAGVAAAAFLCAGCYDYPKPPTATLGDTYTQREKDAADEMFKDIKSLTLADAQRLAIKNNPNYISASQAINAARFRYYQAIGAYSPTVTAGFNLQNAHTWRANVTNMTENYDGNGRQDSFTTSTTIRANLLIFDGLAREFNMLAAKRGVKYYQTLEADACRTLMRTVATAYNTVLEAIENQRIAREDRKFQESSLKDTRYKFEAGAVPLSDVLNFEILANNAEVNMIAADYQYEVAIYALSALMGFPQGQLPRDITFPSDFKNNFGELPSVEIYLDAALANRPDLKGYRENLQISKYQLYQTYSSYSPTINGYVQFAVNTNNTYYADNYIEYNEYDRTSITQPGFSYGITADWTIFNGLIRYNRVREYKANVAIADYAVAHMWLNVVAEVRAAYANYIKSVKMTRLYEKTRDLSAKQRDLVDDEYRAGNAELTRLNEAQRDLVQAETNLAASYISIQNAKAQLDEVVGVNTAEYYLSTERKAITAAPGLESYQVSEPKAADADKKEAAKSAAPAKKVPAEKKAAVKQTAAPAIPADPKAKPAK
ncbi:MAG: TolC family protein [Lentisphaeria bacterium]|nr:TolC family protein [Lentisphaeria bacterium]